MLEIQVECAQWCSRAFARMQNRHTVAGAAARTMAQCTVHPIDTIKTRLQVRSTRWHES